MRVHRLIFRLDFAGPNFAVIDSPGTVMRLLNDMGKDFWEEFQDASANRLVAGQKKDKSKGFSRQLSLEGLSMHLVYDTAKGFDLANPDADETLQTLLKGMNSLCEYFKINDLRRAGIRFSGLTNIKHKSPDIVEGFRKLMDSDLLGSISKQLGEITDIGIRIDGRHTDKLGYHLQFGPYVKSEARKFFSEEISGHLAEDDRYNAIFDVDVYEDSFALTVRPSQWAKAPIAKSTNLVNEMSHILSERI